MITIECNGTMATVTIFGKYPVRRYGVPFNHNANSEYEALLMVDNLQSALAERMVEIRRNAYNTGWADAKSKNPKRECFRATTMGEI